MNSAVSPSVSVTSPMMAEPMPTTATGSHLRLHECKKGAQLRILELLPQPLFGSQDDRVTLRLKELGFLPGASLKVIGFGLMGSDPLAVQVNGTKFALRRAEAAKIRVEIVSGTH